MAHLTHTRSTLAAAITAAISTLFAVTAVAQDTPDTNDESIERVEVIGSVNKFGALKDDVPLLETARSVSIVSAAKIIETGALTLDDALGYATGVSTESYGFGTRGDFYKVRGFDAPEYRDGMQSLSGNYNNTRTEVYTLEQVEVLKGPASVLFGPGSPGGIVNVVSKRPGTNNQNEVVLEVGTHDRFQLATDLSLNSDDEVWQSRFVAIYRDSETQVDYVNDDTIVVAPSIAYQPTDYTRITVLGEFIDRESDTAQQFLPLTGTLHPGANGQRIDSNAYHGEPGFNRYNTESAAISLLAEHQIDETWSVDLSSRYKDGESDYKQAWVAFIRPGIPRVNADGFGARTWYQQQGHSNQFQFDARARANFYTGDVAHRLLMGVSHQRIDNRNDRSYFAGFDASTGVPVPTPIQNVFNIYNPVYGFTPDLPDISRGNKSEDRIFGYYIHNNMEWNDWIVNLGVRIDDVSQETPAIENSKSSEDATSMSASVLRQFDQGVSVYVNYSESFQIVPGLQANGNRSKPEEGEQLEVGVKIQPTGTNHVFNFAHFDIDLSNLPNPAALINEPQQQLGVSKVQGFEAEAVVDFDQVSVSMNYTKLDTKDPNGFKLSAIPESFANVWVNYTPSFIEGLTAGFGVRYSGETHSTAVNFLTQQPFTITTPSYTLADAFISYDWNTWTFSANARNLTNKSYFATCLARGDCFVGEERTVTLRAAYRF